MTRERDGNDDARRDELVLARLTAVGAQLRSDRAPARLQTRLERAYDAAQRPSTAAPWLRIATACAAGVLVLAAGWSLRAPSHVGQPHPVVATSEPATVSPARQLGRSAATVPERVAIADATTSSTVGVKTPDTRRRQRAVIARATRAHHASRPTSTFVVPLDASTLRMATTAPEMPRMPSLQVPRVSDALPSIPTTVPAPSPTTDPTQAMRRTNARVLAHALSERAESTSPSLAAITSHENRRQPC